MFSRQLLSRFAAIQQLSSNPEGRRRSAEPESERTARGRAVSKNALEPACPQAELDSRAVLNFSNWTLDDWTLNVERFPMIRRAIYPGSFDPVTNGHLDVIDRARKLFDEVIVAVAHNTQKQPLFTLEERLELLQATIGKFENVEIAPLDGLLVDFAVARKASAVVRGLRAISDFEFEFQMALMNRKLEATVETIFLMPKEEYTYLSSRIVKEIARLGGDVTEFVPARVAKALRNKLKR